MTVALEEEVTDFLQCRRYQRQSGNRRGYRNSRRRASAAYAQVAAMGESEEMESDV
ncbi:hypothetical protein ACFLWY_02790 [Chloroflexota bacterium]